MIGKQELGKLGEELATRYLKNTGYDIIKRNYTCRIGELDIIAAKANYLIFVEVKTKQNFKFGHPREEVNYHKRQKLQQVARYYISQHPKEGVDYRFDVVGILYHNQDNYQISHIENAFLT
ncbi:YraN family protein [Sporohalobacter salinus]|uniref:YraN family protein n=1 Tax=Sporohalobacter salinus TaxID=1494606 RepID=UPI00195FC018|nr:YraN family protein [Sporohalobacter salinus]MBM7623536.1 putative endonuclease [Sporohalobacter salinus]